MKLAESLVGPAKDLSRVTAIQWGIANEKTALNQYTKYMKNIG